MHIFIYSFLISIGFNRCFSNACHRQCFTLPCYLTTMKMNITFNCILVIFCALTSLQCNPCHTGDLHLDSTRSWFPLKGKTELVFFDSIGNSTNFNLKVIDTTETAINQKCGTSYDYNFITTSLYLNANMTDSIFFSLGSAGWLCMRAYSNNNPNMAICNIFGETKEVLLQRI